MNLSLTTHDYTRDVPTYHFMPRHWDESEISKRCIAFLSVLSNKAPIDDFIVTDTNTDDITQIHTYFKAFEGKHLEYVYTKFHTLSRVKDFDDYNNMRGTLTFKFRVKENERSTEYTLMMNMARLGDDKSMQWKIIKLIWQDQGVDVTDVKIIQLEKPKNREEICVVTTQAGVIKIRLFPEQAPLAVKNWIELSKQGFYDHSTFARVIKGFVIQGGALDGSGKESNSIYNGFFKDEVHTGLYNFNGALCLGNNGPNTNGNQFYIVQKKDVFEEQFPLISLPVNVEKKYKEVGGLPELDGRYTVLGQVFEGMDIVEKIASQKTDANDAPLENPVRILKVEFKKY